MASLARNVLLRMSKSPWLADRVMRRPFARRAVKRFMPGEELGDALDAAAALAPAGLGSLLTKLGENLSAESEALAVRDHYLDALDQIRARRLDAHISVKPTQLGLDFSRAHCAEHLETLARRAGEVGAYLWLDMEDSSYVDRTLELYTALRQRHEKVGLAMQAYLRRTPEDLRRLLPVRPTVRLVKGAYAESPQVAFPAKRDVDLAYYDLSVELLQAAAGEVGAALPIFGTHDTGLVDRIVAKAESLGLENGRYEIHMLYGIRMAEQKALAARGRTVKTLISYGSSWFPWYMRRLAERPANVWFVARSMFAR
jgi:proline dehydrogenase